MRSFSTFALSLLALPASGQTTVVQRGVKVKHDGRSANLVQAAH